MLHDMPPAPRSPVVRIGDFLFNASTGEVWPATQPDSIERTRLPPQPARLLQILVERDGELVAREEIRASLWPDTFVEFDQSLHFCVSQIRSAFGDPAREPTYIETLPRRGYRLMRTVVEVQPEPPRSASSVGDRRDPASTPPRPGWRTPGALALLTVLLVASLGIARACRPDTPREPIRLAIMPFELAGEGSEFADLARLSEWLLAELSSRQGERLEVVGPRSTAAYSAFPFPDLRRLGEELEIDFVLNARFFERDGKRELIVELIRLRDGAHPWVQFFPDLDAWTQIAHHIRDGVETALALPTDR
jgi:DNA-binding winged helix-turn-helix (wHTH) protein/TolB-like protein